jgi:hypothetical protein
VTTDQIADALRAMKVGESREFGTVTVKKCGPHQFRVDGSLPVSFPNAVRMLADRVIGDR